MRLILLALVFQRVYLHKGEVQFVLCLFTSFKSRVCFRFHMLQERVLRWINPSTTSLVLGTLADLTSGKSESLAENALLRQQLIILCRQVKRPGFRKTDRFLLVILARMVRTWKQAIFLIQKYMRQIHPKRARSQSWKTELRSVQKQPLLEC